MNWAESDNLKSAKGSTFLHNETILYLTLYNHWACFSMFFLFFYYYYFFFCFLAESILLTSFWGFGHAELQHNKEYDKLFTVDERNHSSLERENMKMNC